MVTLGRLGSSRCLLIEGCLGLLDNAVEGIDVVHGEVGKDLTIHLDVCGLEAFDEARVSQILTTDSSADTLDPKAAELPLALLTVTILILVSLADGVLGVFVEFRAETTEAFGAF